MSKRQPKNTNRNNALVLGKSQHPEQDDLPALAAGLVHEAKNPLASIHLHLQLLENYLTEVENPELRKKLHSKVSFIKDEISGLNKSLHEFLNLIRNKKDRTLHPIDLNVLLKSVVELLKPQAASESVELEMQPANIPVLESCDENYIKQIAINLILNAIQSFSQNKNHITRQKRVIVKTGSKNKYIYMMIVDNGPGIPESRIKKIFDPYYTTKKSKGSGIGLALVKKMVSEIKAHLEIQSEVNKGTNIAILFNAPEKISNPSK